ncbi:Predicted arabinose efflux permease, MFS family [Nitrosospira multiformis]|uniref:Predicted arabinose efflux permease, MFS family n=1 Tax=Nitrosospira multiformis TaxID=1231 RepID=A0A1H9ZCK2_9PROT|nr:MFS transporter [Nitrosospira multiformis]SES79201.1 Predicted arabinose efflux permease, MFS family [Nitrosospira multiformis]
MTKQAGNEVSSGGRSGTWAPLKILPFRAFWFAALGSNIGTWINGVSSAWVMTDLSPSPVMVSLVQAATSLPMVLFALAAGALTDIVDRRRYLLFTQIWMAAAATMLTVLAAIDQIDIWNLLILTFALGIGASLATPALNVTAPELVPRSMLPEAVALSSLSMNLSRSLGPAIAGVLLAQIGPWAAYGLNALSFIGMIVVLWRWKREPEERSLPPERFFQALRAGVRYAHVASPFRAVLIRTTAFILFAASGWALLPLIARVELAGGPGTYGLLLSFVGLGAVGAILFLPRLHELLSRDHLVLGASLVYAATIIALATLRNEAALCGAMMVSGAAWVGVLWSLQVAAQTAVPAWVRGRALSLYIMVFSGGMALGSLVWGWVAASTTVPAALLLSSGGIMVAALAVRNFSLGSREIPDLAPSYHWAHPPTVEESDLRRGPVLVTVEYEIALGQRKAFLEAIRPLGAMRRRDGAFAWGIFEDLDKPGRYIEFFQQDSWLDHLRQHARVTREDQRVQENVNRFHTGNEAPRVSHFIGGAPAASTDSTAATGT